ncbi:MAG: Ig-like domain-containing protein [Granulosicoccaceae bacterium]
MKKIGIALIVASITLSACGKRTDGETDGTTGSTSFTGTGQVSGGTPGVGAAVEAALNVRVISDRNNIPTGGSDVAIITALITNELNQAVADESVVISSTGGVLQTISATTDENGAASATLALAQDYQNQDITVTVAAGVHTGSVLIQASGSTLNVAGPSALVLGDTAELNFTLLAGDLEPIANHEIILSSSVGNTITPATVTTDAAGRASVVASSANGDDTISVSALDGSVLSSHSFKVAADILSITETVVNSEYPVGSVNDVVVTWESQGQAVAGEDLRFALTAGQLLTPAVVTTNGAGEATITISSSSAGPATISVESDEDGDPATQIEVEFVATTPGALALETSSSRVHTKDTSTVMAVVTDNNGNPVKNQEVTFSSADLKGGQLNPASAITNSAGVASVTFTAGDQATTLNEILIAAEVSGTQLTIEDTVNLTVVERVLNITIGTSNFLEERANMTQYSMPFVVQVADGSGTPLQDATVEVSIEPIEYYKGSMVLVDRTGFQFDGTSSWSAVAWRPLRSATCVSEDMNHNRLLDNGEDVNNNQELDPQDPALLAPIEGGQLATLVGRSLVTDSRGSGYFELIYPASNAEWSTVRITARAQALGAESEDSFVINLLMLSARATTTDSLPPNAVSPYGESNSCSDEL